MHRWIFATLAACSGSSSHHGVDAVEGDNGRCVSFEGHGFTSRDALECGLGPNGPETCQWHISFAAKDATSSEFDWRHSDVGEVNTVVCLGDSLVGNGPGATTYHGQIDHATGVLLWESVEYTLDP